MDESGGSGRPRPGNDESTDHEAPPTARPADAPRPGPSAPAHPADGTPAPADGTPAQADGTATPAEDGTATAAGADPAAATGADSARPVLHDAEPAPGSPSAPVHSDGRTGPEPLLAATPEPGPEPHPTASPAPDPGHPGDTSPPRPAASPEPAPEQARHPDPAEDPHPAPTEDPTPAEAPHRADDPTASAHDPHTPARALAHGGATGPGRPPRRPREPGGGILMGRPFGVPVYVAPSWFLVAALITWVFGGQLDRVLPQLGAARYLVSLFFAVAFYASVLVHELAHTVAALRFGLPVRRIQLQFFGGVSEIEKEAESPGREFVLAFVGPLLSLVLAGIFYLAMGSVRSDTVPGVLLAGLMISNVIVAGFNFLPGLPLDGGRMLRAVVWKITGRPMSGTVAAAWVGRALAIAVLIGLPLLTQSGALGTTAEDNVGMDTVTDALLAAILAAIIWTGAGNSLRVARLREHLPELRARTLTRRAVPIETDTSLAEALRRANAAGARALVVVDGQGRPLSLVRESAIVGVPEHRRPWVNASELAQDLTEGMHVSAELAGENLLDALRAAPATEYLVIEDNGEIYGVLSAADVERAFVKAMARPS
ncbi:site-2 protease family protein [Streptomyces sp. NPDC096198]|uniref:site-2 protease family protein n=1 Tax=Streptomyces sp. NPDC096198 TaxID=3366080 RepID=UPI00382F283B